MSLEDEDTTLTQNTNNTASYPRKLESSSMSPESKCGFKIRKHVYKCDPVSHISLVLTFINCKYKPTANGKDVPVHAMDTYVYRV
jgi:hypothetical protein